MEMKADRRSGMIQMEWALVNVVFLEVGCACEQHEQEELAATNRSRRPLPLEPGTRVGTWRCLCLLQAVV
jgi:hypothetical protein